MTTRHNDLKNDEQDGHIPELAAFDCLKKGKSADCRRFKAEDIKGAHDWTIHEFFNMHSSNKTLLLPALGKKVITVIHKRDGGQIQRTTGRSAVLSNFRNSSPQCSAAGSAPCLIDTKVPIRQDSERHSEQRTTYDV